MRHSNIVSYKLRINGWDMNEYYAVSPQHTGKTPGGNLFSISKLGQGEEMIIIIRCSLFSISETSVPLLG